MQDRPASPIVHLSLVFREGAVTKLWRPNWKGSTRSWVAIDQRHYARLARRGGRNMERMILVLAIALIFVPTPFAFNDLLHLAFALSGFVLLIWWILRNDQNKDRSIR